MSDCTTSSAWRPPAVQVMRNLGLEPDPWQVQVLEGRHRRLLDAHRMARAAEEAPQAEEPRPAGPPEWWPRLNDERIWTRLC